MHLLTVVLLLLGPGPDVRADAMDVLREWDAARTTAYAEGNRGALADLYAADASAGRADLKVLGSYLDRGVSVWQRTQVFSARVLASAPDDLRLRVTDRTMTVIGDGAQCRELPTTLPRASDVRFARSDGSWRVVTVRPVPSGARR